MEAFALPEHPAVASAPRAFVLPPLVHKRIRNDHSEAMARSASPTRPKRRKVSESSSSPSDTTTPSSKPTPRPNMTASSSITLEMLRPHFEEPLARVAARFGICVTLLKKICRRHGISRWPHRQITGLRKSIASMEHAIGYFEGARRESYAQQLLKQKNKLTALLEDPTAGNPVLANDEQDAATYNQQHSAVKTATATVTSPLGALAERRAAYEQPQAPVMRAASPTGPMLPESPYFSSSSLSPAPGSLPSPSPMLLPARHHAESSFAQHYQQLCPPLHSRGSSPGSVYTTSTSSSPQNVHLPPLRREPRPMLPPISSLVTSAVPSASSW